MGASGLSELLRRPTRRETVRTAAAAALAAVICWYFGVNVWHSILLGCALTVASLAVMAGGSTPELRNLSWRHLSRRRLGSRNEIARLSQSLRSGWEPVGLTAERRMHQIARRRLALEGLDLLNRDHREAIERLIGGRAYQTLVHPLGRRPRLRALLRCLDALDAIEAGHYMPPQPSLRRLTDLFQSNLRRPRER
ncbi:MAG: hypothetical protein KGL15_05815 [Acidobacteriota bacterium]|nr:hypothetical protein [Acidobacteriota bacterium]